MRVELSKAKGVIFVFRNSKNFHNVLNYDIGPGSCSKYSDAWSISSTVLFFYSEKASLPPTLLWFPPTLML